MRKDVDDLQAIVNSTARRNPNAEHVFFAGVVQPLFELESASLSRSLNTPAGEATSYFGDVLLGISAVHAKRVQLHELARVIFV